MQRTALGLSALLALIVPGTATLAQQPDRLAEPVPPRLRLRPQFCDVDRAH